MMLDRVAVEGLGASVADAHGATFYAMLPSPTLCMSRMKIIHMPLLGSIQCDITSGVLLIVG
jgi:hypothetical protein